MWFLRYLLLVAGYGLFGGAGSLLLYDLFVGHELDSLLGRVASSNVGANARKPSSHD